jgi:hypothetical protein
MLQTEWLAARREIHQNHNTAAMLARDAASAY